MDNLENGMTDVKNIKNDEAIDDDDSQLAMIFPKPVYLTKLKRSFTEEELSYMKELENECRPNEGNRTSANHYVLQKPIMKDINRIITKEVNNFLQKVHAPLYNVEAYITQSWLNYTKPGQFHHKHSHANSFISGVLYINADPEMDKIYMFNDSIKYMFSLQTENYNVFNSPSWWFPVSTGDIVIFSSDTVHMVQTVEAKETRISLAFNTFLKGTIGHEDSLTGLQL